MTRGRALVMLAVGLVVLVAGALAVSAAAPGGPAAAQPAPTPPLPVPTLDPCEPQIGQTCITPTPPVPSTGLPLPTGLPEPLPPCDPDDPGLPLPQCQPTDVPTTTPPATTPCSGVGCIPQPTTSPPPDGGGPGTEPGEGEGEAECGLTDIGGCITNAINAFFRGLVTLALNPLLDLLSKTLLTTPTPDSLPRIGELWDSSWQILLVCYGLLVLIAGVLVMAYESLQTRHSIKEIAPRIVVGFLAGALSLWVATMGIEIANGLAQAVMGGGVDANSAGNTLKTMILGSLGGGIWIIFIGLFLAGMLIVLLVTYIVRVALTVILIAGAPLALMFHALPQTEGIARWWWKAFGGCLAIQVVQSLTLITAMRVFLAPGGFTVFGPTVSGLVNLLVAIALMYILFKIPFWILGSLRSGGGRSMVGSLARGWLAYKAFGMLSGRGGGGGHRPRPSGGGGGHGRRHATTDPYTRTRTDGDGQYVLPLTGVRRTRPTSTPRSPIPASTHRAVRGRQLMLPLGNDWPENRSVLGRDGQYRLPLDVERVKPSPPPLASGSGGGRRRGGQLELPFDPYKGNRPNRAGQYPLPLDVHRIQATRSTPRPPSPPASPRRRPPRWSCRSTRTRATGRPAPGSTRSPWRACADPRPPHPHPHPHPPRPPRRRRALRRRRASSCGSR